MAEPNAKRYLEGEHNVSEEEGVAGEEDNGIDGLVGDLSVADGLVASQHIRDISHASPEKEHQ